jgi:DNA-binding Xre family transcriptional regulator
MKVSYNKLWKLLIDKGMKKTDLIVAVKTRPNTIAKMGKNENISMDVIMRICECLSCDVGDIMEMIPDDEGDTREKK